MYRVELNSAIKRVNKRECSGIQPTHKKMLVGLCKGEERRGEGGVSPREGGQIQTRIFSQDLEAAAVVHKVSGDQDIIIRSGDLRC